MAAARQPLYPRTPRWLSLKGAQPAVRVYCLLGLPNSYLHLSKDFLVTLLSPLTFSDQSDHNHSSFVCVVYVCACNLASLANQLVLGISSLPSQGWDYRQVHTTIYIGAGDLNSDPHACSSKYFIR